MASKLCELSECVNTSDLDVNEAITNGQTVTAYSAETGATPPTATQRALGTIENGVVFGKDGYLFFASDLEPNLRTVINRANTIMSAPDIFVMNLAERISWADKSGISYLHLVIPDKRTLVPSAWPFTEQGRAAASFIERCDRANLPIVDPVTVLANRREHVVSHVQSGLTAQGCILVAGEIVGGLTGQLQQVVVNRLLETVVGYVESSGDLGSRVDPPITDQIQICSAPAEGWSLNNALCSIDHGFVDLRFCLKPVYDKRLVIFGDSSTADIVPYLHFWFREVIFFQSITFDPDLAALCQPDYLVTATAEQTLEGVTPDRGRPNFFMAPHLQGSLYRPSMAFAKTFSAILRGVNPQRPDTIAPVSETSLPTVFRSGHIALVDWLDDKDPPPPLEAGELIKRRMPEFCVSLSGQTIKDVFLPLQDIHASNLIRRNGVLLFGSNIQIAPDGRWACESRAFKEQFLKLVASEQYKVMFPGHAPVVRFEGRRPILDFEQLDSREVETVSLPVFLATPLEPNNWGRWIVTVIPKIAQFRHHGQGRKFLCQNALSWQRQLLDQFGIKSSDIIDHDPGRSYFCHDLMTVDYSVTNMTVSRLERALFKDIRDTTLRRLKIPCSRARHGNRIFISRMNRSRRYPRYRVLQNEQCLAQALEKLGFRVVEPEFLTFVEQVETFACADLIVCIGGSALYNTVFARDDAKIIDVESSDYFISAHMNIISSMDLQHGLIIGSQDSTDDTPIHKRWSVDVEAVCGYVKTFL